MVIDGWLTKFFVLAMFCCEISSKNHILGFGFKERVMFFVASLILYSLGSIICQILSPVFFLNDSYLFKACIQLRILGELGYESI